MLSWVLKSRQNLSNFVGAIIWVLTLCIFLPFLIYGLITMFHEYDFNELGQQMNANLLVERPPVKTSAEVVHKSLETIAGAFLLNFNPDPAVFIATMTPIIGYFPLSTVTGLSVDNISTSAAQIIGPIFQKYLTNPVMATNPASLLPSIYVDFKTALVVPFETDENYLDKVATNILQYQIEELVSTKSLTRFYELLDDLKNSNIANETAIGGYGYSMMVAYGYLDKPVYMFTYGSVKLSEDLTMRIADTVQYSIFPMSIISLVLISIILTPSIYYSEQPEIRSKYIPFLAQLFSSAFIFGFGAFLLGLFFQLDLPNVEALDTIFFSVVLLGIYGFVSAINCRHFLMYKLFVRKSQGNSLRRSYFLPWCWHSLLIAGHIINYCLWSKTVSEGHTQMYSVLVVYLVVAFIFFFESMLYVLLTRKASEKFVDYHLNVRTFVIFIFLTIGLTIYPFISMKSFQIYGLASITIFYGVTVIVGYLYDSLLLLLLKIYLRNSNNPLFNDIEFMAQEKDLNIVGEILENRQLSSLLLDFAKKQHCDENIRFLMDLGKLKKKKKNITYDEIDPFFNLYFVSGCRYQINVSSKATETLNSRMKTIKKGQVISQDTLVYLFNTSQLEIEELVRLNLLPDFLADEHIRGVVSEESAGAMENRLRSVGLTSKVENTFQESVCDTKADMADSCEVMYSIQIEGDANSIHQTDSNSQLAASKV